MNIEKSEHSRSPWIKCDWWLWAVYGGKDLWKRCVFGLEWKGGVMDGESGDDEGDELSRVKWGASEEDWLAQGWPMTALAVLFYNGAWIQTL